MKTCVHLDISQKYSNLFVLFWSGLNNFISYYTYIRVCKLLSLLMFRKTFFFTSASSFIESQSINCVWLCFSPMVFLCLILKNSIRQEEYLILVQFTSIFLFSLCSQSIFKTKRKKNDRDHWQTKNDEGVRQ